MHNHDLSLRRASGACRLAAIAALASVGAACADSAVDARPDTSVVGTTPQAQSVSNRFSDQQVLGKVYAPSASVPADFYEDPARALGVSFSLRHLRDADRGGPGIHNLCTDDMTTAIDWSVRAAPDWPVITISQTDWYIEIVHERTDLGDWWALQRVYQCQFLETVQADPQATTGALGPQGPPPAKPPPQPPLGEFQLDLNPKPGHTAPVG